VPKDSLLALTLVYLADSCFGMMVRWKVVVGVVGRLCGRGDDGETTRPTNPSLYGFLSASCGCHFFVSKQ